MFDFLIIGGGIAGTSAAARLASLGSTLLLEGESALGYHASGRSAAMFEENYGSASTVVLNRASRAYHEQAKVLSPRGIMLVGFTEDKDTFAEDCETLGMHRIDPTEAHSRIPILDIKKLPYTAIHEDALDIDTDKLLQSYVKTARHQGAQILTGQTVAGIEQTAQTWEVTTAQTTYSARIIVNAAGAWADEVARLASVQPIGLQPYRRSMARVPAPGGHDVSNWPMLFGPGESWYAKPDAGALLISPADEDPMAPQDAWADDMVLAEGIARYQDYVTEPVTRMLSNWAGLRSFAPDRSLVIGADPDKPSFFWLAAQGGYGMQSSPAASQLAADLISGDTSEIDQGTIKALSPQRFR